jgi:hypothetical protein
MLLLSIIGGVILGVIIVALSVIANGYTIHNIHKNAMGSKISTSSSAHPDTQIQHKNSFDDFSSNTEIIEIENEPNKINDFGEDSNNKENNIEDNKQELFSGSFSSQDETDKESNKNFYDSGSSSFDSSSSSYDSGSSWND